MKRRKNDTEEQSVKRSEQDKRVIDLRKPLPRYIPWPSEPLRMTLCAGDGVQRVREEEKEKTDIEFFTKGIEGFNRENKPTNIFCCSPYYNEHGISENIKYLNDHPELKILLVLCDTKNLEHLEKFASEHLFKNKLSVIQEDMACYGGALDYNILYDVLVPGGQYILDDAQRIRSYPECNARFDCIKEASNKLVITKKMTGAGTKTMKKCKKRRKSRKKLK